MAAIVVGVSCDRDHRFSKMPRESITLIAGLGVETDAHAGTTVQHLSRIKRDPTMPNLRQVHLIHAELHDELAARGLAIKPGDMGENITTRGIDLLGLPVNARLRLGAQAIVEIKGLRNPCYQLDNFQAGLMAACLDRDASGNLVRKAGVMGIVLSGGAVKPGDTIRIDLPDGPLTKLGPI
jgi:MOSC domain-containing protein YiiM